MHPFGGLPEPPHPTQSAGTCMMCRRVGKLPVLNSKENPRTHLCPRCDRPDKDLTMHKLGFWEVS